MLANLVRKDPGLPDTGKPDLITEYSPTPWWTKSNRSFTNAAGTLLSLDNPEASTISSPLTSSPLAPSTCWKSGVREAMLPSKPASKEASRAMFSESVLSETRSRFPIHSRIGLDCTLAITTAPSGKTDSVATRPVASFRLFRDATNSSPAWVTGVAVLLASH